MMRVALGVVVVVAIAIVLVRVLRKQPPVGYAMVPAKDFDPSMEDVRRFAAGLLEARSAVGWRTKTRRMVRLAIVSDPEGDIVHLLSSSPRSRSVLERVGYSGCDLRTPDDVLGDRLPQWLTPAATDEPVAPDPADIPNSSVTSKPVRQPMPPMSDKAVSLKELLS